MKLQLQKFAEKLEVCWIVMRKVDVYWNRKKLIKVQQSQEECFNPTLIHLHQ